MKNKIIIIVNILVSSLIFFNRNIYAETVSIDSSTNELKQNIEDVDNTQDNNLEQNIYKNIEYKIHNKSNITSNDAIIMGSIKNCNNIEIKCGEEKITQNIEKSVDEWIDFSIEIDLKEVQKIDIIFSNEFGDIKIETIEVKDLNIEKEFELLSEITSKTKEIKLKVREDIANVYVVIDGVEYKENCINNLDGVFSIILPELKDKSKILIVTIDNNGQKIEKEELIKEIEEVIGDKKEEKDNKKDKQNNQTNSNEKDKNILDLKVIELNNKSSKIKGMTFPISKVDVEINGINYSTISDKKGYFEINLFIKKKEGTEVLFKIKNDKNEKTFIKYIQDKIAPKKPYISNKIKENNEYIKGKTEPYANIIVNIKSPTHIVKNSVVSVRKKPKKGLNKIGRLLKGTNILVLESKNGWSKIEFKDYVGYVKTDEIEEIDDMKEFTYKGKANNLGEYEVKINKHKNGSRVRVKAQDENNNISEANVRNIEKE